MLPRVQFQVIDYYPLPNLMTALQRVPLLSDRQVKPYAQAKITYEQLPPALINFSSYYVLEHHLPEVMAVMAEVADAGYDPFDLRGIVTYRTTAGETRRMGPLVVEAIRESLVSADGSRTGPAVLVAIDGAHRLFVARMVADFLSAQEDVRIGVCLVDGAQVPFY